MADEIVIDGRSYVRRNPLAVAGLIVITFGIYGLYWYYVTNRDLKYLLADPSLSPGVSLLAVTLGGLLIVPPYVSVYRTAKRIQRVQHRNGGEAIEPVLGLVLMVVIGSFVFCYYQAS